jgi:uncharacterized protein YjbJ (UPF0337 family)
MDEDRAAGAARRTQGSAKAVAGDLLGDTELQAEGTAERAAGGAREAAGGAGDAAEAPGAEVRHLREEVAAISAEAAAADARAEARVRRVDAAVGRRIDAAEGVVRDHPLLAVGGAALLGYLLARLTGGTTRVYDR